METRQFIYPFTHPLAADEGSTTAESSARVLLRRVGAIGFLAGAATISLALVVPGRHQEGHTGMIIIAALFLSLAVTSGLGRKLPDPLLLSAFPVSTILITLEAAVSHPPALTASFYVWPLAACAYFMQRREVIINHVFVLVAYGVSLILCDSQPVPVIAWMSIAVVTTVVVVLITLLKEHLAASIAELQQRATLDPLTGILNRREFDQRLDVAVARALRLDIDLSLLVLDIDHFKAVNDTYGHAVGDQALQRVSAMLSARARANDAVARLGGEEFAVLLEGTDAAHAQLYAEDVRTAIGASPIAPHFTVSIGVAQLDPCTGNAVKMMRDADRVLYRAKETGRNRVVLAATPHTAASTRVAAPGLAG